MRVRRESGVLREEVVGSWEGRELGKCNRNRHNRKTNIQGVPLVAWQILRALTEVTKERKRRSWEENNSPFLPPSCVSGLQLLALFHKFGVAHRKIEERDGIA